MFYQNIHKEPLAFGCVVDQHLLSNNALQKKNEGSCLQLDAFKQMSVKKTTKTCDILAHGIFSS